MIDQVTRLILLVLIQQVVMVDYQGGICGFDERFNRIEPTRRNNIISARTQHLLQQESNVGFYSYDKDTFSKV
jgi:Fe-S oxidoreductase